MPIRPEELLDPSRFTLKPCMGDLVRLMLQSTLLLSD